MPVKPEIPAERELFRISGIMLWLFFILGTNEE